MQSDVISGITNLQPEHHYETVRPLSSGGSTQQRSPGRNYEVVSNQLYQPAKGCRKQIILKLTPTNQSF